MTSPRKNPYENIYRSLNTESFRNGSRKNIEDLARHVGFLHNTLGMATKDLILMISKTEENSHQWELVDGLPIETNIKDKKNEEVVIDEMEDEIEIISSGGEKEKCENLQKSAEKPSENLVNLEEGEKFSVRMNEKDVEIQKSPKSIDKAQSSQCIDLIDEQ